jgi:hypothetical protein
MSATQEVYQLLTQDVAINKCMKNGLINTRALAKFLIDKFGLQYSEEAVVSAIRRYEPEIKADVVNGNVLDGAMIFAKNGVACLTTDITSQDKIGIILQDIELNRNVRISRGKKYTKILVYEKELEILQSHFLPDQIKMVQNDLVEVRVLLQKDAHNTIGLLSMLAAQVALYSIPIQELIVSVPEIMIYVKSEHGLKTQEALMQFLKISS